MARNAQKRPRTTKIVHENDQIDQINEFGLLPEMPTKSSPDNKNRPMKTNRLTKSTSFVDYKNEHKIYPEKQNSVRTRKRP